MDIFWIITGFIMLVLGGEYLVRASVALSFKFQIPKVVIGITVVSFATSIPELLVSLQAAILGSPAIAINNVVGSNIANIGLVLGLTAIIAPITVNKIFYKITWPVMMLFSIALYFCLTNNNTLDTIEGSLLFIGLIIFLIFITKKTLNDKNLSHEDIDETLDTTSNFKIIIWLLLGAVLLYFGSEWLVKGAKHIAESIGVSESVIGISLIAVGTSVPELAASVIAVIKKEKAISLGNLVGSNIFNIGSVLGLTAMIKPISVTAPEILNHDIFWMLGFSAILIPLIFSFNKLQISRLKGVLLVVLYAFFIFLVFSGKK